MRKLMAVAMAEDFSWERSASIYERAYAEAIAKHRTLR
jgi:glycogen synthase